MSLTPPADQSVECPRCRQTSLQRFHGPCDSCRDELRTAMGGAQREVAATEYEPKMNVTPNAVASRD